MVGVCPPKDMALLVVELSEGSYLIPSSENERMRFRGGVDGGVARFRDVVWSFGNLHTRIASPAF